MGGYLMLRKRYGEKWTILLRISQGSKIDNPKIYTLKYFLKRRISSSYIAIPCFPSVKGCGTLPVRAKTLMWSCLGEAVITSFLSTLLVSSFTLSLKLKLNITAEMPNCFRVCYNPTGICERIFMSARLIVSFSGSLQWCACFPDSALSSIQVIKKN